MLFYFILLQMGEPLNLLPLYYDDVYPYCCCADGNDKLTTRKKWDFQAS